MVRDTQTLFRLVRECVIRRLSTKESMEYIKNSKMKISERTYRRYKNDLETQVNSRLSYIGQSELITELIQRIDTIKDIEREYWRLYYDTKNEKLKKSLLDSLSKIKYDLVESYNDRKIRNGVYENYTKYHDGFPKNEITA